MSESQTLLDKLASLRERLEQARGLAEGGTRSTGSIEASSRSAARLGELLDSSLRQLAELTGGKADEPIWPKQLTARARRVLTHCQRLLHLLREAAASLPSQADDVDPRADLFREAVAMTESVLRMVQVFPDAPSSQLHLCEGLEAVLGGVERRVDSLRTLSERHRVEEERVAILRENISRLGERTGADFPALRGLVEDLLAEADRNGPLCFHPADPADRARFVACHGLNVAQVIARIGTQSSDVRGSIREAVLAGLVHDVGMLHVPVEVWRHSDPFNPEQRRAVESHVRVGVEIVTRWLPRATWLAEAVTGHHERADGTGYPNGLREAQISPLARLLAVCDTYASLCVARPHRPARDTRTALTDTLLLAEDGQLDRSLAELLLHLTFYPVGSVVELADGKVGLVVATHAGRRELNAPARPVVALLADVKGKVYFPPQHLDLARSEEQSIVRALNARERFRLLGGSYPEYI